MSDQINVDMGFPQTPNYPAMEQKLRQAAREAITARGQMLKELDKGLRRHMNAKRIYEYNAALAEGCCIGVRPIDKCLG